MKKLLAALLCIAMLVCIFTGCGETDSTTPQSEASAVSATESNVEVIPAEESPVDEAAIEEVSTEESVAEPVEDELPTLSYPVSDGSTTFLMLQVYNPNASAVYGNQGDYSSALTYENLAEATGVNVEFKMLAEATYSTQIDLIIASGDTPDMYGRSLGSYDSKLQQAIEDEVVIDILPLVEENAPDLYNLMQRDTTWADQLKNADGTICKIANYTLPKTTEGGFVRGDWLEELGMEAPSTLDELTAVLEAFNNNYDTTLTMLLDSDLGSVLDQFYNMSVMGFKSFSFQLTEPGSTEVICSMATDEYINYLLKLHEFYEKGIINSDFLSTSKDAGNLESCYINGESGVWKDDAKYTYNNAAAGMENNPNWTATPIVIDKSDYHMNQSTGAGGVGMTQVYISADCTDPELALQFINYGYTQEGGLLIQVGVEDVTFTYDENGKMSYTELITNNPDGWTSNQASYVYLTDAWMPCIQLEEVFSMAYSEETLAAYDLWTNAYAGDDTMTIPLDCTLTADEQTEVFTLMSDCMTLFSESAGKVILGDMDESGFRDVIDTAMEQGLTRITEIYQGAYDRYLAN